MHPALQAWRDAGHEFSHDGRRYFCRVEGAGPELLLIHGFPTSSWDWHAIWPALVARYRVLAPDLLGFGFSDKPRGDFYRIGAQADACEALLALHGVKQAFVLAHDYGVSVAQELLARQREGAAWRMRALALLNGGLFPQMHRPILMQRLLLSPLGPLIARLFNERGFRRSFASVFGPQTRPGDDDLRALWELMTYNAGHRIAHWQIRYIPERVANQARWVGALTETRVPLRLINGPADPVSGAHMAQHYARVVPNADVVSLPGIGHYPQVEAPAAVQSSMLGFFDRVTAAEQETAA